MGTGFPTTTILTYFETGDKPTQAQFADLINGVGTIDDNSPLNNFAATTDPSVNDDNTDGYSVGSRWTNTNTSLIFECLDATAGVADWQQIPTGATSIPDGDKGDITVSGSGTIWTVDNNAITTAKIGNSQVTLAKQASGTANRLQGFDAAGLPSEITVSGQATVAAGVLTVSAQMQSQIYSSGSGNFITPSNITTSTRFKLTITGGGGGGGYGGLVGTGGGAGATCIKYLTGLNPSTSYTYAVGAGGAGGTSGTPVGTTGGTSTFNDGVTTYSAAGGVGGVNNGGFGGLGGTATNGDINITGGDGAPSDNSTVPGGAGGASFWGGGGSGSAGALAKSGRAYGSGGGAGTNSNNGGAGASGLIVIEWMS